MPAPAATGTVHSDTGYCPHRWSHLEGDSGWCCMGTVEKAEIRTGKAARSVNRDARPTTRFVRHWDSAQRAGFLDMADEEIHVEEHNRPWVL